MTTSKYDFLSCIAIPLSLIYQKYKTERDNPLETLDNDFKYIYN